MSSFGYPTVLHDARRPQPSECPLCAYDRRFPGFEDGGWMQMENNGPIVSCPLCNPNGTHAVPFKRKGK